MNRTTTHPGDVKRTFSNDDKQELWLKKAKIKYMEKLNQKQNLTYSDVTFHPHVNQVSLDILEMKNILLTK